MCHKALAFIKRRCFPEYPPHVSISLALPRALASWGILPAAVSGLVAYSVLTENLQRVTPFPHSMGCDRRLLLYAGIHSSGCYVSLDHVAWIHIHFGAGLTNQRWPVLLDDASTIASLVVSHSHRLDGITASGSQCSAFSSRFCPLRTSRGAGDDAVTRTTAGVGLDNTKVYYRTNIE